MTFCNWCKLPIETGAPICKGVLRYKEPKPEEDLHYYHHGSCCTQADKDRDLNKEYLC